MDNDSDRWSVGSISIRFLVALLFGLILDFILWIALIYIGVYNVMIYFYIPIALGIIGVFYFEQMLEFIQKFTEGVIEILFKR